MHDLTYSSPKNARAVIKDIADFDQQSGSRVERTIFNNRLVIVIICALLTCFLGYQASKLKLNANFEGTIPLHDPFMINYLAHADKLQSQGNALRIAVQANDGTIASARYLATLSSLTNDVLNLPGINRPLTTSLWTPNTRWTGVEANTITSGTVY